MLAYRVKKLKYVRINFRNRPRFKIVRKIKNRYIQNELPIPKYF